MDSQTWAGQASSTAAEDVAERAVEQQVVVVVLRPTVVKASRAGRTTRALAAGADAEDSRAVALDGKTGTRSRGQGMLRSLLLAIGPCWRRSSSLVSPS